MMVVMLILSIVLAAMAPVMTTRNKTEQSSPWKYSEGNLSDAYYGLGESQTAMIGQREFETTDETAKLIINSSGTRPSQISFKRDSNNVGVLRLNNGSMLLGSLNNNDDAALGESSLAIGYNVVSNGEHSMSFGSSAKAEGNRSLALGGGYSEGFNSTAISGSFFGSKASGDGSLAMGMSNATGRLSIAIAGGTLQAPQLATNASGECSIALGSNVQASGSSGIAIGTGSISSASHTIALGNSSEASEENSIAIGDSKASALGSIAIGDAARALSDYALALGLNTEASGSQSIALGYYSTIKGSNSIGIGNNASSDVSNAIVMGTNATVLRGGGIAIGNNAYSGATNSTLYGDNAVAIGSGAKMGNDYGVALGNNSGHTNKGTYGVAIGYNACQHVTGSNKICIGANSGPNNGDSGNTDDVERIYIGSQSKYDKGSAVLEVHNTSKSGKLFPDLNDNLSSVIIHGNLIVMGRIATRFYDTDDLKTFGRYNRYVHHYDIDDNLLNSYVESTSDRRLKYVGEENSSGLEKIRALKVFNYTFKKDKKKTPHVGVMAQDLQKIFPDAVKKGADGFLTIRMEDMFYAVINAIKELDAKVSAQDKKIKELEARIEKLEAKLK